MIQFGKPTAGQTVLGQIKTEVQTALISAGMPSKLYLIVASAPPSTAWLRENGLPDPVEGTPTISSKDGRVMYNFGARAEVGGVSVRLQGNCFLPKDGFSVDKETHNNFVTAKLARAAQSEANRLKMNGTQPTEAELEAGETIE